ncbi:lipoprotein [Halomonas sp. 18H]|nr:lipoprotein [Halomonas almeriensis]MCW4151956.1 lipoprotein [Halomonas sp. 18H]MDN3552398.1 lipoprotein [Halomonas almeriensis]
MVRLLPLVMVALLALSGCGQKGPLYQPDDPSAAERYGRDAADDNPDSDAAAPERTADEQGR